MSCLYIIATEKNGKPSAPIKVGMSNNAEGRLRQLQTASPYKLILLHRFELPDREIAQSLESCFHGTQKEHRLSGEWFSLQPAYALELMCLHIAFSLKTFTDLSDEEYETALEMCGERAAMKRVRELLSEARA